MICWQAQEDVLATEGKAMLLRVVEREVRSFFESDQWHRLLTALDQDWDCLHAHVYVESSLHPHDLAPIVKGYFNNRAYSLRRDLIFLSHGHGVTNIYNVHPSLEKAHFEIFMYYNSEVVIEPAGADTARGGTDLEVWDKNYMDSFFDQFSFADPTEEDITSVRTFYQGKEWWQGYNFMSEQGSLHCHVPVLSKLHPHVLAEIGAEEISRRGWTVDKTVTCVYGMKKREQIKTVFLCSDPQVVVELDYDYNADAVIEPRSPDLMHKITEDDFRRDTTAIDYYRLPQFSIESLSQTV